MHHIVQMPNSENDCFLKSIIFQWRDVTKSVPFKIVIIPIQIPSETMENRAFSENEKLDMLKFKIMHFPEIIPKEGKCMYGGCSEFECSILIL